MATNGNVIETLVVRLVGDNSLYKKAMQESNAVLKKTVKDLKSHLQAASGYWSREASHVAKSQKAIQQSALATTARFNAARQQYAASAQGISAATAAMTRDVSGRLRDMRGRFVAEGAGIEVAARRMSLSMGGIGAAMKGGLGGLRGAGNTLGEGLNSFTGRAVAALGAGSISGIIWKTVNDASNAQESIAKFNAVFNSEAAAATKFVAKLANDIGRSEQEIRTAMSAYQSLFLGLRFQPEKAFEMSMALEKLTLDFAAFHNISDDESMTRFISAMSGSAEVLDQFGVNIRQAEVEQELLRMGINKSVHEASEAEKTMARLNLIMGVMGRQGAIGAAARESESFANQLKGLKAEVLDLSIKIGQDLMPMAIATIKWLKELTVEGQGAASGVGGIGEAFLTVADILHTVALAFQYVQARITNTIATAVEGLSTLTNGGRNLGQGVMNAMSGIPQLSMVSVLGQAWMVGEDGKGRYTGMDTYAQELRRSADSEMAQADKMALGQTPSEKFRNRQEAPKDPGAIDREVTKLSMGESGNGIDKIMADAAWSFGKNVVDYGELFGLKVSNAGNAFMTDALNLYNNPAKVDQLNKATAGSAVQFGSAESEIARSQKLDNSVEKNTEKIAVNIEAQKRLHQRTADATEGLFKSLGALIAIPR